MIIDGLPGQNRRVAVKTIQVAGNGYMALLLKLLTLITAALQD